MLSYTIWQKMLVLSSAESEFAALKSSCDSDKVEKIVLDMSKNAFDKLSEILFYSKMEFLLHFLVRRNLIRFLKRFSSERHFNVEKFAKL